MNKRQGIFSGLLLTATIFLTGNVFAAEVNTPNADFNEIGNALVSSGYDQTTLPNNDVVIGTSGDSLASYSASTGNWIAYH